MMNRIERLMLGLNARGKGLEIGPSHNPVAPKRAGFNVEIIDHLDRAGLQAKYRGHGVDLDAIEDVDYVWTGQRYAELTGKTHHYDWIIASHVIEHTTDLIGFVNQCDELLAEQGILSLAVPDKRYCFDHFRSSTPLASVIDAHAQGASIHTAGAVAEYFLHVVSKGGKIAWDRHEKGAYALAHSAQDALDGMAAVRDHGAYLDIHRWCFTPHSFRLLLEDLFTLGHISLREESFSETVGCEFYITLSRGGAGPSESRLELLDAMSEELRN